MTSIPPDVMLALRQHLGRPLHWHSTMSAMRSPARPTQERVARLLGTSPRTVRRWERDGTATLSDGYAYVGIAYRLGGAVLAAGALSILAQASLIRGAHVT